MKVSNVNKEGKDIPVTVFKSVKDGKTYYQIGLSKKVPVGDGTDEWKNGYVMAQFNKEVVLENKDKIYLKNAILDFYIDTNKITRPFIRVFEFELEGKEEFLELGEDLPF